MIEYIVKIAMPHGGVILQPGDRVLLHPRQAKYLLGTHLARRPVEKSRPAPAARLSAGKPKPKKTEVTANE
jgi:hypothetical protein